ncbi:MAG: nucleotidyltransferase domain-containing protein [Desulfuromonadales bacterium]
MYSSADFEIIKNVVISSVPLAESVYLFGSYAKGTAREQSDVDIAILLEHDLHWRERNVILNRLYSDMSQRGYNVDFVLKRADKFRTESELPTLSRVILREGKLLWTNN